MPSQADPLPRMITPRGVNPMGIGGWSPRAAGLREERAGLWTVGARQALSYPDDAHALYRQVEESSFWFRHRNACVVSTVDRLPPDGCIADVGGGNGYVARGLIEAGHEVVLVEPGEQGAHNAWQRGVRPVVCARLEQAGFARDSLGGIGVFDVIEHIDDDVGFLEHLRSYMRPKGRLYVTVPAFQWLWSHEDDHAGHFRRYSPRSLRETLQTAGFEVEYLTAMFAWLPLPVFLLRSLPALLGRRASTADRTRAEHRLPSGVAGRLLQQLLDAEHRTVARGGVLSVGGSLLAVARRS